MLRSGQIVAKNMTVDMVKYILLEFPRRYSHYSVKGSKNIWKCSLIKHIDDNMIFQLIDKNFEPPRCKKSDAPMFYVTLEQRRNDVFIKYTYCWQKWKKVFTTIITFICALLCMSSLFYVIANPVYNAIFLLIIHCLELLLLSVWMISNRKHDNLTILIFVELLKRHFYNTATSSDES